jgi:hypothetical protein
VWKKYQTRGIVLVLATGLVVSLVRHGLQDHWASFPSWGRFFLSWVIHTIGVALFTVCASAAIFATHRFFLGYQWDGDTEVLTEVLAFYVVMTVLVAAIFIAVLAPWGLV